MSALRLAGFAAASTLLTACASASPPVAMVAGPPTSTYGLFLAGRAALADGRSAEAARYFASAGPDAEGAPLLAEQAFTAALLAGDVRQAAALAPPTDGAATGATRLGQLTRAVDDLTRGSGQEALAILGGDGVGYPHRAASALLAPWAAAAAGETEQSLARPTLRGDRVVEVFGRLGQAQLLERARRYDEAREAYAALAADPVTGGMFTLEYGQFLERRGQRKAALELYDAVLAKGDDGSVAAAKARVIARRSPPALATIREGAAQALLANAAGLIVEGQNAYALAYVRLALALDPARDEAWLMVGDLIAKSGDLDGARAAYAKVPPSSGDYGAAQAKLAWGLQQAGDKAGALKLAAAALAAEPGDALRAVTYADLLRANDRYAESAAVLDPLIAADGGQDWRLLYMRGVALERAGRWAESERDLKAALALSPDEADVLNYLGYSWIDKGEHLEEALAMVQKAVEANPRSGAMIDSLGWAYFRLGDYPKAVELLERAVVLEPADIDVNGHLGDAYWHVGRRVEAQFQWRRVLSLSPDEKAQALTEAKLESGLGEAAPLPKAKVADAEPAATDR